VLAEILTAGLAAQCMLWQTSPAATELEERMIGWLGQLLGLPPSWTGAIQDTASTATLCALICARERATGSRANDEGLGEPLAIYTSTEAHSSVEKGVKIAGLGRRALRRIPTDDRYGMLPDALEAAIEQDLAAGVRPACVVATVGTTSSTGVDPLAPIGAICARHGLWLHVDAAYAGSAAIVPERRWILDGVEQADSFVFNPHKWLLTNFDCSAYFVKDPAPLVRAFEIHPEYLKTGVDSRVKNYRDWGVPLGRRFRALKLWFVLRSYGAAGLRAVVREHLRLAELFAGWVDGDPRFALAAPVEFGLVCFRLDDGRPAAELDRLNRALLDRLNATGRLLLTQTELGSKYVLRMSIGARTTEERHVRAAWEQIQQAAAELMEAQR
jgi:aromatic-L-amino-acid decarboxylase